MHKTRIQESVLSLLHPLTTYIQHNTYAIAVLHMCLELRGIIVLTQRF